MVSQPWTISKAKIRMFYWQFLSQWSWFHTLMWLKYLAKLPCHLKLSLCLPLFRFARWSEFESKHSSAQKTGFSVLHKELEPFLFRRVKKDVEKSLPSKVSDSYRLYCIVDVETLLCTNHCYLHGILYNDLKLTKYALKPRKTSLYCIFL